MRIEARLLPALTGDSALTVAWAVRGLDLQRDVSDLEAPLQNVCRRHQQGVSVPVLSLQHEMSRERRLRAGHSPDMKLVQIPHAWQREQCRANLSKIDAFRHAVEQQMQ